MYSTGSSFTLSDSRFDFDVTMFPYSASATRDFAQYSGLIEPLFLPEAELQAPFSQTAAAGGDTTVAEVVVYPAHYEAPPMPILGGGGGGGSGGSTPPEGGGGPPSASAVPEWVMVGAQAYADSHFYVNLDVDQSDPKTAALINTTRDALEKLYIAAAGQTFLSLNGPGTYDSNPAELYSSLQSLDVTFTTENLLGGGAQTNHYDNNTKSHIYVNPTQVAAQHYETQFHYGAAVGNNFVVYHELGHAMSDYVQYFTAQGGTGNAEAFANSYGYSLSALAHNGITLSFPNPAELASHGGWIGL
jgi:hypothetical protein